MRSEEGVHSAFISFFLNPRGVQMLSEVFLVLVFGLRLLLEARQLQ